jgi:hypothetical protein
MKISKKRLTEIILQECEMVDDLAGAYNMDGIDKEGLLAKRQLHDMETYARELSEMLTDTTQLESWVQAKLTKAADYLKTVKHYVEYGMEEGAYDQVVPQMDTVEPEEPVDPVGADLNDKMVIKMLEELSDS